MNDEIRIPWMMSFSRQGLLRFISHLDWLAMAERIFLRADIPIVFSEGYHPRPVMKTSPPLPTGVASRCELMQVFFCRNMEQREASQRILKSIPEGIELNWIRPMRFKPQKNPYKAIAAAEYIINFRDSLDAVIRKRVISLLDALKQSGDDEQEVPMGPDAASLKPLAGRLLEIGGLDEFIGGTKDSLTITGKMDGESTLHAAKLGFYLYESGPLKRYPLITKLNYFRVVGSKYEEVFT